MYNTCYCHWFTYLLKELRCDDPNLSHWYLAGRLHVVSSLRLIDCRSRAKITPTFGVPATLLDRGWLPMTPVRQRTAYLRARRVAYRLTPPPNVHVEPIITWLSHGLWSGAVCRDCKRTVSGLIILSEYCCKELRLVYFYFICSYCSGFSARIICCFAKKLVLQDLAAVAPISSISVNEVTNKKFGQQYNFQNIFSCCTHFNSVVDWNDQSVWVVLHISGSF